MKNLTLKVNAAELQSFFERDFPQMPMAIENVELGAATLSLTPTANHLRPGNSISGPTLMQLADASSYAVILAHIGIVPMAVTSNLNIHFFQRPAADKKLIGTAQLLKLGKRLAVTDVRIRNDGSESLLAQASVTYALPESK